jgi:hypothetical protein
MRASRPYPIPKTTQKAQAHQPSTLATTALALMMSRLPTHPQAWHPASDRRNRACWMLRCCCCHHRWLPSPWPLQCYSPRPFPLPYSSHRPFHHRSPRHHYCYCCSRCPSRRRPDSGQKSARRSRASRGTRPAGSCRRTRPALLVRGGGWPGRRSWGGLGRRGWSL